MCSAASPGLELIPARDERQLPVQDGSIWLWNAQPSDTAVPVGLSVDPDLLASIPPGSLCVFLKSTLHFGNVS